MNIFDPQLVESVDAEPVTIVLRIHRGTKGIPLSKIYNSYGKGGSLQTIQKKQTRKSHSVLERR